MASFHWVANGPRTVKGGIVREDGEYVPEVDDWKDPELWERAGHIRKVPGPPPGMPGGDGCHIHDMHGGRCSKCEFVESLPDLPKIDPVVPPSLEVDASPEPPTSGLVEDPVAGEILDAVSKSLAGPEEPSARLRYLMAGPPPFESESTPDPEPEAATKLEPPPEPEAMSESFEPRGLSLVPPPEPVFVSPADPTEPEFVDKGEYVGDEAIDDEADLDSDGKDVEEKEFEPYTKSELMRMRKADLQEIAGEWEIVVGQATKPEIVALILEAQEE